MADWEAGRRFPTAVELLRACSLSRIDVERAFLHFHEPARAALGDPAAPQLHAWLDALRGQTSLVSLAERSGRSRFALGRWLSGQAQPRVPDFLRVLQAITGRASDLVAELVPIERVPAMEPDHRARAQARRLAFDHPWTEAILRLIETPAYRSLGDGGEAWLAETLGLGAEQVERGVAAMRAAGVVRRRGGRWVEADSLNVDTRGAEGFNRLRAHWSRVAAERLAEPLPADWFGYNVVSVSDGELEQVREILRGAFREIRGLVASSDAPERAALINMQLLTWDTPAPSAPDCAPE